MERQRHACITILPCTHLPASRSFYERLGFCQTSGDDLYAILEDAEGAELHLRLAEQGSSWQDGNPAGLYLRTEAVDVLAARFAGELLGQTPKPEDKPWGMYEFAVSDPDNALVRVGWPSRLRTRL